MSARLMKRTKQIPVNQDEKKTLAMDRLNFEKTCRKSFHWDPQDKRNRVIKKNHEEEK